MTYSLLRSSTLPLILGQQRLTIFVRVANYVLCILPGK